MIVDFHTHIWPRGIAEKAMASLLQKSNNAYEPCTNGTQQKLIANMIRFDVDLSIVQPVVVKPENAHSVNLWAHQISHTCLRSFGGIHPDTDDFKRDIDFVCQLTLPGIKLHPEFQHFSPDEPRMMKIYDYALSRGLILMFHGGYDPAFSTPVRSNPQMFAKIRKELGGGRIVVAHLGGLNQWDEVEEHLAGEDVYLDTSIGFNHYSSDQFLRIVKKHGADKILFGSDSPWSKANEEIAALRSLDLTDREKELILGENAIRILKEAVDKVRYPR